MDTTTLVSFFANSKWQRYKPYVEDFTEAALKHSKGDGKKLQKYLEFFVDLINRVDYEQKMLDNKQGDSK